MFSKTKTVKLPEEEKRRQRLSPHFSSKNARVSQFPNNQYILAQSGAFSIQQGPTI